MFKITKNLNKNMVVVSLTDQNEIHPYWIMYEKDPSGSSIEELTLYEKSFVYGCNIKKVEDDHLTMYISALPNIIFTCFYTDKKAYVVLENIQICISEVKINCINVMLYPKVVNIKVVGYDKNNNIHTFLVDKNT